MRPCAWLLVCVVLLLTACAPAGPGPTAAPASTAAAKPEASRIVFMAGYKPQANLPFTAMYVAQERGYFAQEGLEVEIRHSAGQGEHLKLIGGGHVQVITTTGGDLLKRIADPGLPLVAFALFGQRGDQAFAVRKDAGIESPRDWAGKTIGYKGTLSAEYLAIADAVGLDRSTVREVSAGFDPRVLVERRVDVWPVFESNEPYLLARLGVEVRLFRASDYGVPTLGLTYTTTRDWLAAHPETATRFLRATLRATHDALADPDAAVEATLRYATGEERAHQRYMLGVELEAAQSDLTRQRGLGWATREQWAALEAELARRGALAARVDVNAAWTDEVLRRAYGRGS